MFDIRNTKGYAETPIQVFECYVGLSFDWPRLVFFSRHSFLWRIIIRGLSGSFVTLECVFFDYDCD